MRITNNDKNYIAEMYGNGVELKTIEKRLNYKYTLEAIKSYTKRNLKHLREQHEFEKNRTRCILKKTYIECSREICDMSFVKYNRSIYKTNRKGCLVVDKKVAPVVTFDTPKIIRPRI